MAKSLRSKWKKKQRAIKSVKEAPKVQQRVVKLHTKLGLCASGKIGQAPMQDPPTNFGFSNPQVPKGERLKLDPVTTNVYGLSDPTRLHAQQRRAEHVSAKTPLAGLAVTAAMLEKNPDAFKEDVFMVNGKVAGSAMGATLSAKDFMSMVETIESDEDEGNAEAAADIEGEAAAPPATKLKSMVGRQKGEVAGGAKLKSVTSPRKRLVSGTAKGGKGVTGKRH